MTLTYRGFRISEVCGTPFAYAPDGYGPHTIINPSPVHSGVAGLVRAIDAHLFMESVAQVEGLLQSRRDHISAGTWDPINSCPKGT